MSALNTHRLSEISCFLPPPLTPSPSIHRIAQVTLEFDLEDEFTVVTQTSMLTPTVGYAPEGLPPFLRISVSVSLCACLCVSLSVTDGLNTIVTQTSMLTPTVGCECEIWVTAHVSRLLRSISDTPQSQVHSLSIHPLTAKKQQQQKLILVSPPPSRVALRHCSGPLVLDGRESFMDLVGIYINDKPLSAGEYTITKNAEAR